jgi:hypothetical protein
MHLLHRTQRQLKRQGLSLSEKALQVMTLAAETSSQVDGRRHIAVESVITNLVKANTVATAVFTAVPYSEEFLKTIARFRSIRDETAWPPEDAQSMPRLRDRSRSRSETKFDNLLRSDIGFAHCWRRRLPT